MLFFTHPCKLQGNLSTMTLGSKSTSLSLFFQSAPDMYSRNHHVIVSLLAIFCSIEAWWQQSSLNLFGTFASVASYIISRAQHTAQARFSADTLSFLDIANWTSESCVPSRSPIQSLFSSFLFRSLTMHFCSA